jgi:hypothetical protein
MCIGLLSGVLAVVIVTATDDVNRDHTIVSVSHPIRNPAKRDK